MAGSSGAAAASATAGAGAAAAAGGGESTKRDVTEFLPWVEKYRPSALSELISQGDIIGTVSRLIDANRLPHLLFYGPPGTGKTTTILALARRLYGPAWASMTLEVRVSCLLPAHFRLATSRHVTPHYAPLPTTTTQPRAAECVR